MKRQFMRLTQITHIYISNEWMTSGTNQFAICNRVKISEKRNGQNITSSLCKLSHKKEQVKAFGMQSNTTPYVTHIYKHINLFVCKIVCMTIY